MAKLVNKKTGKEFNTTDPKSVLKRFPKTFREKPATKINAEVAKKENDIKDAKSIEVNGAQTIEPKNKKPTPGKSTIDKPKKD